MIDTLPLGLFDDADDDDSRPVAPADTNPRCQWCGVASTDGATFCAGCGGRLATDVVASVPGLTELTPEQAEAERRPIRRPEADYWVGDEPPALVVAVTAIEIAAGILRNRRSRR